MILYDFIIWLVAYFLLGHPVHDGKVYYNVMSV